LLHCGLCDANVKFASGWLTAPTMTIMAMRQCRALRPSHLTFLRCYSSSNVPAKVGPIGTMSKPTPDHEGLAKRTFEAYPIGYKSQGSSVPRTIRNIWKAGFRRAFWQILELNDTKVCSLMELTDVGWYLGWNRPVSVFNCSC
jgi:hypothetical protein